MFHGDTVVAISTPPGRGGIGVVRLSGPASLEIARSMFRPASGEALGEAARARFGRVVDCESGDHLDEAVATYFKAPHSYSGEDVVELSCHGSPVVLRRVLARAVALGARVAEPGEFTFRAFFNRRIDLAQAQAVRDLIDAQTDYQARVATRQLEGALSKRLTPLKDGLVEVIVHLESSVEFVEDDISPEASSALLVKLDGLVEALKGISRSFSFGRYVKEGFDLAIVGRPNVGKSSVFNRLIGTDRAIVTELPGTTRDALYESTSISGVPVRLIDTAGIRETNDVVETIGITRSRTAIADADISLVILDRSEPLTGDDAKLLDLVPEKRRIVVLNKDDLERRLDWDELVNRGATSIVAASALTGGGFDELGAAILARLSGDEVPERDDVMLTDARHYDAVRRAIGQVDSARGLMRERESEEVVLLRLHGALAALGEVTGETLTEDILGQIFATFCVGK
ncbi:MAG TPA: tRNA uridine-5-carboxymethylaminomethyl(34) synthesis GTPase MnmE [Blastocatellia bacterium]|nr:tRNA uridine-5-carboxymethylaminomethyl(34) synthesis GTPase MnmE [Blastocatellia bacterium]